MSVARCQYEPLSKRCLRVAGALGLEEEERTTIQVGAYLHDLGKTRVPVEILNKEGL